MRVRRQYQDYIVGP